MIFHVTIGGRAIEVRVGEGEVTVGGRSMPASLTRVPGRAMALLSVEGRTWEVPLEHLGRGQWAVGLHGERWTCAVIDERTRAIQAMAEQRGGTPRAASLVAPMPGLVVRVLVVPGQQVQPGEPVVVLEAMKMENELRAAAGGVVARVAVQAGQAVNKGDALVVFET